MTQSQSAQSALIDDLKAARQAAGLTQEQLAVKTGIPRTTIAKIESGFRNTTVNTFLSLSKALNIDLELVKKAARETTQSFTRQYDVLNLVQVSKKNILSNYDLFQKLHPSKELWPVLKSNAYGHDIRVITTILANRSPRYVCVDSYFEALQVWEANSQQKVLLIGPILPSNFASMKLDRMAITVFSLDILEALSKTKRAATIHLEINTGMNRLGVAISELAQCVKLLKQYPNLKLEGVSSHFADADSADQTFTFKQEQRLQFALHQLKELGIVPPFVHQSATAGAASMANTQTNAVRLGIGLYGYNPLDEHHQKHASLNMLKPAMRCTTKISQILSIKAGEGIGYNQTFIAKRDMRIGVLPIGYYDILNRKLSNKGFVKYKHAELPIVGRVSMNLTTIDLLHTDARLWDEIEVISSEPADKNSIEAMAKHCGTIPYEVLVKIAPSTRRVIVEE